MFTRHAVRFWLAIPICLAGFLWMVSAAPRDEQWKKVREAQNKGLPRTALEHLQPIIDGAIADKDYPQAIKAIGLKVTLEGNIQGNKPQEKIIRMKEEIAKAPKEMLPMMESILGHWYWHFFQQNRWRFVRRTATAEAPGNDIMTWDLPRIFREIDKQFGKALAYEEILKATPINAYDGLLQKGGLSDAYRPTLFDFVAFDALNFYVSGEQAAAKAEDAFELLPSMPVFGSVEEFLKWDVKATDSESRTIKAIKLYQNLLKFHQNDKDQTAFLDADLHRLSFAYNKAVGEEKKAAYMDALKRFAQKHAKHELSAIAQYRWANLLHNEGEYVEAHKIASAGVKAYPDSNGGKLCYNLIQQIEGKYSHFSVERVWNQPFPPIQVKYRNLTEAHFRIVKADWVARLNRRDYRPEHMSEEDRKAILAQKPEQEWSVKLPETTDYHERAETIQPPKDLTPGFYFLVCSHDKNFSKETSNQVSIIDFWVSNLAIIVRTQHGSGKLQGFVLDANTGEPIADAKLQTWSINFGNKWQAGPKGTTDKNGMFALEPNLQRSYALLATTKNDSLASIHELYVDRHFGQPQPYNQTIFYTDRSIYRPGQTIQFKGLCIHVDQQNDTYTTIGGREISVRFADVNGKEIAKQKVRTNEYGSFSGSFTAPRDRLMGRMHIHTEGDPHGSTYINVEEYKRPKFQVTMDAPKNAPKLNAEVDVPGKAMAYTGSAINGAQVRYRVTRQVRYPAWWGWCYWWRQPKTTSQEIAHGVTVTEADGSFHVKFIAKPDLSVAEKEEPTFSYAIKADVVDSTGETRSGSRSVNVGYTALKADLTAEEWQTDANPINIKVSTTSLDGEGQQTRGQLRIHELVQPEKVQKAKLSEPHFWRPFPMHERVGGGAEPKPDLSDVNSWSLGKVVSVLDITTDAKGQATANIKLEAGMYRAVFETQDRFGKRVSALLPVRVLKPEARTLNIKIPNLVSAQKWSVEPGTEFNAVWGTGYDTGRAYVEIEHRGKILQSYWTDPKVTQTQIKQAVKEDMRGGFTLRVTMVRENRAYLTSHHVDVPWTNKNLSVKWEHFVSKLEPGKKETWTAIITGPDAKRAVAEMVAGLYDASLDQYLPHNWRSSFNIFRQDYSQTSMQFENVLKTPSYIHGHWPVQQKAVNMTYRRYPNEFVQNLWGYDYFDSDPSAEGIPARPGRGGDKGGFGGGGFPAAPGTAPPAMADAEPSEDAASGGERQNAAKDGKLESQIPAEPVASPQDLSQVSARKNLNETAFFFPHLVSDAEGVVKLTFTIPEALTEWKFMAFAHDTNLRSGYLQDKVVTAKDLMIQPNSPRFVREGDVLEFTVKVSNQSEQVQSGKARLTFSDARTGKNVDGALANLAVDQSFELKGKESKSLSWRLAIPDGMGPLVYKAVGSTDKLSDGEEGYLPVLSRRILVTESLPLPIRGNQVKNFDFRKLRESDASNTIQHQSVTVQMVSQPAWYAVMALPYLMEYPYECSEQTFNRLYANALARHIAASDPKIRKIFDRWKGTDALDSPLEKNQDLKSVLLEETPWLRQAVKESEARKNVGILFDDNRLNQETARLGQKMADMQLPDGMWPWFPGGRGNEYITLYITTGYGRLRHLKVATDASSAIKAVNSLDAWMDRMYKEIVKKKLQDKVNLSPTIALYLYGRSFFLKDQPIADRYKVAVDYFVNQAQKHWLKLGNRQSQAHIALALHRWGDKNTSMDIMKSIKERSVSEEELGMFWRDTERSHWWYRAPIETQAMMIEAFHEIMDDASAVEDCKVWLLKQKQTQDWKTTKATADAVYGLLMRGDNLLKSDALVEVSIGGNTIKPEKVEAGTGFYEQRYLRTEVKPAMGQITVKKTDEGVSWGSVHWQYLEDISKVTPQTDNPLKLVKTLYTKKNTKAGPVLEAVKGPLNVGDELVVRIELRTDRDMEYVHLKDGRGSGTEPVNVLSRYRYQDGLGYYETTRDTASHFFIDYLPKGTYVFEYSVRVVHRGQYQTGMAEIQCMYAPEFNSHSESLLLDVK